MEKMKMIIAKKKKDILVRGIPKQLHEEIKKAAKEMTISEFMIKAAMNELSSVTGVQYSLSTEEYPDVKKTAAKRFKQKYLEKRIADLKANGKDSGILAGKLQLIEKEVHNILGSIEAPGSQTTARKASAEWHSEYWAELERLCKGKTWDEIRLEDISDDGTHVK